MIIVECWYLLRGESYEQLIYLVRDIIAINRQSKYMVFLHGQRLLDGTVKNIIIERHARWLKEDFDLWRRPTIHLKRSARIFGEITLFSESPAL